MRRIVSFSIGRCCDCFFLHETEKYNKHFYTCGKMNKNTIEVYSTDDEILTDTLKDWFEKECPLSKDNSL